MAWSALAAFWREEETQQIRTSRLKRRLATLLDRLQGPQVFAVLDPPAPSEQLIRLTEFDTERAGGGEDRPSQLSSDGSIRAG